MGLGRGGSSSGSELGEAWLEGLRCGSTGVCIQLGAGQGEPHQVVVGSVGVIFWEGDIDPQGYAVGKDGQQDENVERPQVDVVKDASREASECLHSLGALPTQCSPLTPG